MSNKNSQSGFTLIELLIVVLIIGILASIAIPVFNGQRTKAKNSVAQSTVRNAVSAASSYMTQTESHASTTAANLATEESTVKAAKDPAAAGSIDSNKPGNTADDKAIFVGGTGAATFNGTGVDGGVTICAVSKGDRTYCARQIKSGASYGAWVYKDVQGDVAATVATF